MCHSNYYFPMVIHQQQGMCGLLLTFVTYHHLVKVSFTLTGGDQYSAQPCIIKVCQCLTDDC